MKLRSISKICFQQDPGTRGELRKEGKITMDSFKKQLQGRQPRKLENSVAIQLGRDPAHESHEKKMALGKKPAAEP